MTYDRAVHLVPGSKDRGGPSKRPTAKCGAPAVLYVMEDAAEDTVFYLGSYQSRLCPECWRGKRGRT